MSSSAVAFEYDSSHPHYTPSWLSERVAKQLPKDFSGQVIDPACGAGNLLAAAAMRFRERADADQVSFVGFDISPEAVSICAKALEKLAGKRSIDVEVTDYLVRPKDKQRKVASAVVMNPPFLGYGSLSHQVRRDVRSTLGLPGKFNLSHAFVVKALADFSPQCLIAVLPSNWYFSKSDGLRSKLCEIGGSWRWENIGDAFDGIAAHVGILTWISTGSTRLAAKVALSDIEGFNVRQGVATGSDAAFRQLAALNVIGGESVPSVVGKDVGRSTATLIWIPSSESISSSGGAAVLDKLPPRTLAALSARACVLSKRRGVLEFHENYPDWFLGCPKILLPEIVAGDLRVEFDAAGIKLPLHSVFAVRVASIAAGKSLKAHLLKPREIALMRRTCSRLAGGAIRLNAHAIRQSVRRWLTMR